MKILAISCSPRKQGNTEILLGEALQGAKQEGAEVELYSIIGKDIQPCDGCRSCDKTGECYIKDDMQVLYKKMLEADGIIFGTPIYSYSVTPWLRAIIDRTVALKRPWGSLANKVAGVVATAGSLGLADGLKDIYFWIVTRQMIPANFVAAYCLDKGDVKKLEKGMKAAKDLGRQMALIAAMKFEYPAEIDSAKHGYGTWVK
jgi:multimeric flavodoxin WrbA